MVMYGKRDGTGHSILLATLQLFLAFGALGGGAALMIDPGGELIAMPLSYLEHSPFRDYFVPGLMLFCVFGVLPAMIGVSLLRRRDWRLAERLNLFADMHWSWTFALYSGFALIVWIAVQAYLFRSYEIIHLFYTALGLVIQLIALLPAVRRKYKRRGSS